MSEARQAVGPIRNDKGVPVSRLNDAFRNAAEFGDEPRRPLKLKISTPFLTFAPKQDALFSLFERRTFDANRFRPMKKSRRFDATNVEGYIVKARKIDKSRNLAKSGKISNKFPRNGARRRKLNWK